MSLMLQRIISINGYVLQRIKTLTDNASMDKASMDKASTDKRQTGMWKPLGGIKKMQHFHSDANKEDNDIVLEDLLFAEGGEELSPKIVKDLPKDDEVKNSVEEILDINAEERKNKGKRKKRGTYVGTMPERRSPRLMTPISRAQNEEMKILAELVGVSRGNTKKQQRQKNEVKKRKTPMEAEYTKAKK
ncbi:hypothetical protein AgCh_036492 [Apium graveolens]